MGRRLLALSFATALLAACQAATPLPAVAEPAAMAPADRAADQAFDRFARSWMAKLRAAEKQTRGKPQAMPAGSGVVYRAVGTEFRTELRPTGHPTAPYVGLLRYKERLFQCTDASLAECTVTAVTPVTEIFRYQGGRWVY